MVVCGKKYGCVYVLIVNRQLVAAVLDQSLNVGRNAIARHAADAGGHATRIRTPRLVMSIRAALIVSSSWLALTPAAFASQIVVPRGLTVAGPTPCGPAFRGVTVAGGAHLRLREVRVTGIRPASTCPSAQASGNAIRVGSTHSVEMDSVFAPRIAEPVNEMAEPEFAVTVIRMTR
jgi:hypothetical protein